MSVQNVRLLRFFKHKNVVYNQSIAGCASNRIIKEFNYHRLEYNPVNYNHNSFRMFVPPEYFNDKNIASINWDDVKNELYKISNNYIKPLNIDAQMLIYFKHSQSWDLGFKYIDDLKKDNINTATEMAVINFLAAHHTYAKPLTEKHKKCMLELCNGLLKKHSVMTENVGSACVSGFSVTDEWEKCYDVLKLVKKFDIPSSASYSKTISSSFKNMRGDLGWQTFEEMISNRKEPFESIYTDWMDYCVSKHGNKKTELFKDFEKLLEFCSKKELKYNKNTATHITSLYLKHLNWNPKFVKIDRRGECPCCGDSLPEVQISAKEWEDLKQSLFQEVMLGTTVFAKSSPTEIKEFMKYIDKCNDYDVVIDGLNIAYAKPNEVNPRLLMNVVESFLDKQKKILVIGRKHMLRWHQEYLRFLEKHTYTFYVNDLSFDDTFLLYACLHSPGVEFVSRDLMRSHKSLFKNYEQSILFKRWQLSHQYLMIYSHLKTKKTTYKYPCKYSPFISKTKSWHIPYDLAESYLRKDVLDFPQTWICLSPPKR